MKNRKKEISDEEFVQQLIAKLENLEAEADFVYNCPPSLSGEEAMAEDFVDDYGGIMACDAPQFSRSSRR